MELLRHVTTNPAELAALCAALPLPPPSVYHQQSAAPCIPVATPRDNGDKGQNIASITSSTPPPAQGSGQDSNTHQNSSNSNNNNNHYLSRAYWDHVKADLRHLSSCLSIAEQHSAVHACRMRANELVSQQQGLIIERCKRIVRKRARWAQRLEDVLVGASTVDADGTSGSSGGRSNFSSLRRFHQAEVIRWAAEDEALCTWTSSPMTIHNTVCSNKDSAEKLVFQLKIVDSVGAALGLVPAIPTTANGGGNSTCSRATLLYRVHEGSGEGSHPHTENTSGLSSSGMDANTIVFLSSPLVRAGLWRYETLPRSSSSSDVAGIPFEDDLLADPSSSAGGSAKKTAGAPNSTATGGPDERQMLYLLRLSIATVEKARSTFIADRHLATLAAASSSISTSAAVDRAAASMLAALGGDTNQNNVSSDQDTPSSPSPPPPPAAAGSLLTDDVREQISLLLATQMALFQLTQTTEGRFEPCPLQALGARHPFTSTSTAAVVPPTTAASAAAAGGVSFASVEKADAIAGLYDDDAARSGGGGDRGGARSGEHTRLSSNMIPVRDVWVSAAAVLSAIGGGGGSTTDGTSSPHDQDDDNALAVNEPKALKNSDVASSLGRVVRGGILGTILTPFTTTEEKDDDEGVPSSYSNNDRLAAESLALENYLLGRYRQQTVALSARSSIIRRNIVFFHRFHTLGAQAHNIDALVWVLKYAYGEVMRRQGSSSSSSSTAFSSSMSRRDSQQEGLAAARWRLHTPPLVQRYIESHVISEDAE